MGARMLTDKDLLLLRLSKCHGIGPARLHQLAADPGLVRKGVQGLSEQDSRIRASLANPSRGWSQALVASERDLEQAERTGTKILTPEHPEFPSLLRKVQKKPYFIYVRGALAALGERSVAIIGTREPTSHGAVITGRIGAFFAERKWSIVSGLALGCDALAHRAALDAQAPTVAVLAHGLQTVAPKQHQALAEIIVEAGGALVSAFPFGTEPSPGLFVQRDYLQASLARGVIMIQSGLQGGSLHASRAALELDRILAFPTPTAQDRLEASSKIQANLVLESLEPKAIAQLLGLSAGRWSQEGLFPIANRDGYSALEQRLLAAPGSMGTLFG